jgi:hypothetical protein
MKLYNITPTLVLLLAVPMFSFGQYFQGLYDIDSTQEWGINVFVQPDSNYFIIGTGYDPVNYNWSLFNAQISKDGITLLSKHTFQYDSASLYSGNAGEARQLQGGGYITPLTTEISKGGYVRGWAGFIKYNSAGDTIFLKTYTDTSVHYDVIASCAVMPDGGYIGGGGTRYELSHQISGLYSTH